MSSMFGVYRGLHKPLGAWNSEREPIKEKETKMHAYGTRTERYLISPDCLTYFHTHVTRTFSPDSSIMISHPYVMSNELKLF